MTAAVTKLKGDGVTAILLTTSGKQTASAAGVAAAAQLDVPLMGNNPVFSPLLLSTPAGPALEKNLYISGSTRPLSSGDAVSKRILKDFKAKFPKTTTNAGVTYGYALSSVVASTLRSACEAKDLSRAGLVKAFRGQKSVDTEGLLAPLDFSVRGGISSRETRILRPSKATIAIDGLATEKELFVSDIAKGYKPE